ncbi:MAG TPA: MCE family protein [Acidimicrobiales bacterium]
MKKYRVWINLSFFAILFLALAFEATRSIITVGTISHPYTLSAEFANASGVLAHDEVDYLGVTYGEVTGVTLIPGGARVTMSIQDKHLIPTGSIAHLDLKSAIGEQYINFEPPAGLTGQHGPYYPARYVVPISNTTVPLEFSELLRSAANLIGSIPPDSLSSLLHELAIGLNGRTDSLRALTESGDKLSSTLVTRTQALDQLISKGTALTHVVTEHRADLGQQLSDLQQVAQTLQNIQPSTNRLLDRGSQLFQTAADLVAAEKANLDCILKGLNPIIDLTSTPQKLKELTALLQLSPVALAHSADVVDINQGPPGVGGPWARIGFILNANNPAPAFNPPAVPPPPPAVPPCTSPLKPRTVADYRPASGRGQSPLSPLAGDILLAACLVLVAASLVQRRLQTAVAADSASPNSASSRIWARRTSSRRTAR